MFYEHVHLFEAAFVQEHGDAFACCVLAFFVLFSDSFLAAAKTGFGTEVYQLLNLFCLRTHYYNMVITRFCCFRGQR